MMPMLSFWRNVFGCLAAFLALLGGSCLAGGLAEPIEQLPVVVAIVNEAPLSRDALIHGMRKHRYAVLQHFLRRHAVEPGPDFWGPAIRYGGENPFSRLLKMSLDDAIGALLLLQLAEANGIPVAALDGIDAHRQNKNQQRAEWLASGGIVYGPQRYSERAYQDHYLALVRIELEALILQQDLRLPARAIRKPVPSQTLTVEDLLLGLRQQAEISYLIQSAL